jgi:hypothetical protein
MVNMNLCIDIRIYILDVMCHMRRRIHVSYEEEDTCASSYASTYACVDSTQG